MSKKTASKRKAEELMPSGGGAQTSSDKKLRLVVKSGDILTKEEAASAKYSYMRRHRPKTLKALSTEVELTPDEGTTSPVNRARDWLMLKYSLDDLVDHFNRHKNHHLPDEDNFIDEMQHESLEEIAIVLGGDAALTTSEYNMKFAMKGMKALFTSGDADAITKQKFISVVKETFTRNEGEVTDENIGNAYKFLKRYAKEHVAWD